MPVISYCLVAYRPIYARLLIEDLCRKTSVPFEILVWINTQDGDFLQFIKMKQSEGLPIKIVGSSSENIGMQAFKQLFPAASAEMVVQLDDDVVAISRRAAQIAADIFTRYPNVGVVGGHVWQDDWTTGGRPLLKYYLPQNDREGLYAGPIDGGFTVYRKGLVHLINGMRDAAYFGLGVEMVGRASEVGFKSLLCSKILMFHVVGAPYVAHFGMLDFEIEKYRRLGRNDIVAEYEAARSSLPLSSEITRRVMDIFHAIEVHQPL